MNQLKLPLGILVATLAACSDSVSEAPDEPEETSTTGWIELTTGASASTGGSSSGSTSSGGTSGTTSDTEGSSTSGDDSETGTSLSDTSSGSSIGETETSSGPAEESTSSGTSGESSGSTGGESSESEGSSSGDETSGDSDGDEVLNLVANPGFELDASGWQVWGDAALSISTLEAHSGTQSGLVTGRTASWHGVVYSLLDIVEPGARYDVSVFAQLSNIATSAARLTIQTTCDGEAAAYPQIDAETLNDAGWTELAGIYVVPDCVLTAVNVYVDGLAADVDYFIDDLSVALRPPPTNLVENSDFEVDASGWTGRGDATVSVTTDRAHGGAQSGVATGRTASWHGATYNLLGLATPGASYTAQAWVTVGGEETSTNASFTMVSACDVAEPTYDQIDSSPVTSEDWVLLEGTFNVPDCTLTALDVYVEGPPTEIDLYIDDVRVEL